MRYLICMIILIFISSLAYAEAIKITKVEIHCGKTTACKDYTKRLKGMIGEYRGLIHVRQTLKVYLSTGGIKDFVWTMSGENSDKQLVLRFTTKRLVGKVNIEARDSRVQDYIEKNSGFKADTFFEESKIEDEELKIRQYMAGRGYPNSSIKITWKESNDYTDISINVSRGTAQRLSNYKIISPSPVVEKLINLKFIEFLDKPFDAQIIRARLDELEQELFSYGYYLISLYMVPKAENEKVEVTFRAINTELFTFTVAADGQDGKMDLGPLLRDLFKRYKKTLDNDSLRLAILEHLRKNAFLGPEVVVKSARHRNKFQEEVTSYHLELKTGDRTRVNKLIFTGNNALDDNELQELYERNTPELAEMGYLDEAWLESFKGIIKDQYLQQGYVRIEILGPTITYDDQKKNAQVEYLVNEGSQARVDEILLSGLPDDIENEILDKLTTKQGSPFNPFRFSDDLKIVVNELQDRGYYFAEITNADAPDIVIYGQDRTSVKVNIKVVLGKMLTLGRVIVVGNKKTQTKVIKRRIAIKEDEPLSPTKVKNLESSLSATGLFNSVRAKPLTHNAAITRTDLIVQVTERDYGLIEVAPGYRTDIGVKLSGQIAYLNLGGMNRSLTLRGQVNQRFDLNALDPVRRREDKKLLEYNLSTIFNQQDIFDTFVEYNTGLTYTRKRFYNFDADIFRWNNTLSKDFSSRYSASLRHQLESIDQFDATEERDNGSFEIGALTPSFTADYRNSRINPTSGAFFNMSCEFANPYFGSQKKDDLTINFYKLISRNRFYIPFKNGTFAISLVGGMQENLARDRLLDSNGNQVVQDGVPLTEGYIPNIKVFRLTGTDIVRGFSDEEINRLISGQDIGDDRVQNKAYMANIKLEPRYFINDALMAGVFFDAGRVYVDQVELGELRQSVGVTFKIVTPVGTLDFDYGIKLLRKKNEDGSLESPGRFHVSIGFF